MCFRVTCPVDGGSTNRTGAPGCRAAIACPFSPGVFHYSFFFALQAITDYLVINSHLRISFQFRTGESIYQLFDKFNVVLMNDQDGILCIDDNHAIETNHRQ